MDAIEYFKGMRESLCETYLKGIPKDSVGYQATLMEMSLYDEAIKALKQKPCKDAISRQAAIEAAEKGCLELKGVFKRVKGNLKALPSVNVCTDGWIPVSEKLPENGCFVIVTVKDESGDSLYIYSDFGWYLDKAACWIIDAEQRTDIIAWMPLPQPYKVESEG